MTPATSKKRKESARLILNKTSVAGLSLPATGRVYFHDSRTQGLAVCVTAAGSKTFYLYRWATGRPVRQRLGAIDEITVEQARDMVRKLTGEIVQGVDVQARKRAAREELSFGELAGTWLDHAKEHKRTWKEDDRLYRKFLATWAGRRLSTFDAGDVERLANRIKATSGPYQANRVLALLSAMFRHASKRRLWNGSNPAGMVTKFPEYSRERFLSGDEMPRLFAAIKAADPMMRDFFMLALLTGARRGNVQSMRWVDLDLTAGIWTISGERSKNGQPVVIPLVKPAIEILRRRAGKRDGSDFVFASHGNRGHLTEPKAAWDVIRKAAGLDDLRIHDLRRTMGSWLAAAGISLPIIAKALGHVDGSQATHVYARLGLEPVREATEAASAAIMSAGKPKKTKAKPPSKEGRGHGKKKEN